MLKRSEQILNTAGRLSSKKFAPISASHKSIMAQFFANNAYPKKSTVQKIAHELGLDEGKVYNWFRYERRRVRYGKYKKTQSIGEFVCVHSRLVSIKLVVNISISWYYIKLCIHKRLTAVF